MEIVWLFARLIRERSLVAYFNLHAYGGMWFLPYNYYSKDDKRRPENFEEMVDRSEF